MTISEAMKDYLQNKMIEMQEAQREVKPKTKLDYGYAVTIQEIKDAIDYWAYLQEQYEEV